MEVRNIAIPKSETIWVTQMTEDGRVYYITTSKTDRSVYFLYESDGGVPKKVAKGGSPARLEVYMRLGVKPAKSKHGDDTVDRI